MQRPPQPFIERRYIDLSAVSPEMRNEFLQVAGEAQAARGELAAEQARATTTARKSLISTLIAALIAGLVGYWRGRRHQKQQHPRIRVEAKRP